MLVAMIITFVCQAADVRPDPNGMDATWAYRNCRPDYISDADTVRQKPSGPSAAQCLENPKREGCDRG